MIVYVLFQLNKKDGDHKGYTYRLLTAIALKNYCIFAKYFTMKKSSMKTPKAYLLLCLASIFWGVSFILTKELFFSEPHLTVSILITFRLLMATVTLIPTLLLLKKIEKIERGDLKWFLLLAFAEPFAYNLCETGGLQYVDGSLASVIVATIPLFVPFGMAIAYREKITLPTLIGVVLSFIGIYIMLSGSLSTDLTQSYIGVALLAGAVFIAVLYMLVLVKIVKRYKPLTITAYQNLLGLIYYIPLTLAIDGSELTALSYSPKMILLVLALGVFCSTLAYAFNNYGVKHIGASSASIFNNTIPIFTLIAALIIGQEQFAINKVIGVVVVICGVIIAQQKRNTTNYSAS